MPKGKSAIYRPADESVADAERLKPTAADIFSGCGGLTVGLKLAGYRVLGAVDSDPLSTETYVANHQDVTVWQRDIRRLSVAEVKLELGVETGELDLLAGCPPCQGFSALRTLNGFKEVSDRRNDLLFEFLRFARVLKPRSIMMENVPALAKDDRFRVFCQKLENLGYAWRVKIQDAADYGVPQRRRRLILIGARSGRIRFARKATKRMTVRQAIGALAPAGHSHDPLHDIGESRTPRVTELIAKIPKDGGSRSDLPDSLQLACHRRSDGFKDVYGRISWAGVAPTITTGCFNPSKGRFLHPEENRAITLREAALLQGLPKDYYLSLSRGKSWAATLVGNALPPELVRRHAVMIKRHALGRSAGAKALRERRHHG